MGNFNQNQQFQPSLMPVEKVDRLNQPKQSFPIEYGRIQPTQLKHQPCRQGETREEKERGPGNEVAKK